MSDTSSGQRPSNHHKETWLQKRGSKSRLSKQDEVEETDATEPDTSPNSEASDSTVVAPPSVSTDYTELVLQTPYPSLDPENALPEGLTLEQHQSGASGIVASTTESSNQGQLESQLSTDSTKGSGKTKLQRTNAVNLGDDQLDTALPQHDYLQVSPTPQHQHAGKLSKDNSIGSENGSASGLSRDSSFDTTNYTDSTGIDLEQFIEKTLNKNQKDRMMLLRLEQDMDSFIRDEKHQFLRFPAMTSYHRMLVHRIAAFFGLDHNVDQSGKSVVVSRTPNTRIPDFKFRNHIQGDLEDMPKKILKKDREASSLDDGHIRYMDPKKSRSFEERKENYEEARKRIFKSQESEAQMHDYFKESLGGSMAILKPGATWSSTDSSGYSTDASRHSHIPKAHSLGSTPSNLSRDNSRTSTLSSGSRMSKTDSQSSGISDMKTLGRPPTIPSSPPPEISEHERTTPSMSSPLVPDGSSAFTPVYLEQGGKPMAVWVCTDLDSIPPGSVLINHNTGQPYQHQDGSLLRWPPPKPPPSGFSHNQHSQLEHKYQDQSAELQQQVSQMSLTSPQGPVAMESGGNPSGEPPSLHSGGIPAPLVGGGGPAQQQPVIQPQSYTSPVQPAPVPPPGGQMAPQTAGMPTQYSQMQQSAYFPTNPPVNGQPVRYIYNQVSYTSPPGVPPQAPPPTSQTPEAQVPTVIHQPLTMQTMGPPPAHPQEGAQYQPTPVYNYPAFQQMTVQSVDYMQGTPFQQQQPQTAPPSGSGGYQQSSGQQGGGGGEMSCSGGNTNTSSNQQQGGQNNSSSQPSGSNSQGAFSAQQQNSNCYIQPPGGATIQYYSANPSANNAAGTIMTYQQPPSGSGGNHYQGMTCIQATSQTTTGQVTYRPKTPPSHHLNQHQPATTSHQPLQSSNLVSGSSYPPVISMSQATVTVASGGHQTVSSQPMPQYGSYITYPTGGGQHQPMMAQQQPMGQRMVAPLNHHPHPHHPHMIAMATGPCPPQPSAQQPQPLTVVRPVGVQIGPGARSTPPPQLQYPQGMSVVPTGAAPVKVITMQHPTFAREPLGQSQESSPVVVNEKGDAGANGVSQQQGQTGMVAGGVHQQVSLVGGGGPVPPLGSTRGFMPPVIPTPIRHQNPTAFRTASPVLQPLQNEPRLMAGGQPYPRALQQVYTRPRVIAPNSLGNPPHVGSKSGNSRRLAAVKQSQESLESNASSTDSAEQSTDTVSSAQHLLEVTGLPSSLKCGELAQHLSDLIQTGGAIYIYSEDEETTGRLGNSDVTDITIAEFSVFVGFQTDSEATRALKELRSNNSYSLQTITQPYDLRSLCQL